MDDQQLGDYQDNFLQHQVDNGQLTLEDFDSRYLNLHRVPLAASQTCQGQALLKPIITPITYSGAMSRLNQKTI